MAENLYVLPWEDDQFRALVERWRRGEKLMCCQITDWLRLKGVTMADVVDWLLLVEAGRPSPIRGRLALATPPATRDLVEQIVNSVEGETNPSDACNKGVYNLLGLALNLLEQIRDGRCEAPRSCAALVLLAAEQLPGIGEIVADERSSGGARVLGLRPS